MANNKDKAEVLSLLNIVFSENQRSSSLRDDHYWNWKFRDSPFGPSSLIVAEQDGKIIGVDNWWPWEFNMRGQTIKALQPCDSVVHPDYRRHGYFKQLRIHGLKLAQEQSVQLLFNFPNANSLPANLSLGWVYQGPIPWRVKILKPLDLIKGAFSTIQSESITVEDQFRLDVDEINRLAQKHVFYDRFLKTNRVPGFHEWRYKNHPHRSYGMVQYEWRNKKTVAIFTINKKGRNLEMVIVDFVGSSENTISLLRAVVKAARLMNVGFIAVMENACFKTNEIWKLGFIKKRYKNMVALPLDLKLEHGVKGYFNWSLMAGLHDSI